MPQPPTPNMSLIAPTPGSDPNTWGTILNTLIDILDAHTHKAGSGVKIGATAIQWDADITAAFAGTAYALLGTRAVDFTPVTTTSVSALSSAFFVNSADNNAYFRNSSGVNVQLTNGPTLAITASGGIGGDYTSVGAEVAYVDATDSYTFKQQVGAAVRQYARMQSADVDLFEYKAHPAAAPPTNRVRLSSPAALAASYTVTFPGAQAAGEVPVFVTAAGQLIFGHGDRILNVPTTMANSPPSTGWTFGGGGQGWSSGAAGRALSIPVPLVAGDRIKSIVIWYQRSGGTLTFDLQRTTLSTGATAVVATTNIASGTAYTSITLSAINHTMLATDFYYVIVTAGGATDLVVGMTVTYDRIA